MLSFTFVSTANAFVLRGAVPVFVDIRPDTLNLDESLVEAAITPRTRAICAVHYAGVSCEMDEILAIAQRHGLGRGRGRGARHHVDLQGRESGAIGGARRAEFPRDQEHHLRRGRRAVGQRPALRRARGNHPREGHQPQQFFRGQVDKYTWVGVACPHLPRRDPRGLPPRRSWSKRIRSLPGASRCGTAYRSRPPRTRAGGRLRRPVVPEHCTHNARMYYLLLRDLDDRSWSHRPLEENGIGARVPLHPAAFLAGGPSPRARGGRIAGDGFSERPTGAMPLWIGLEDHLDRVW